VGIPEAISYKLAVPQTVIMRWVTVLILIVFSFLATRKPTLVPGRLQNGFELIFEFVRNIVDSTMGEDGREFYPFFFGLFFFILAGNLLCLIPGFTSPTSSLNTTVALAILVFFSTHYFGIKRNGFKKYVNHFFHGVPWWLKPFMLVIEIISEFARPLSLSVRLFGNIIGKEVLLAVFAFLVILLFPSHNIINKVLTIVPFLLRPAILLLGAFISFIQAFVFTILSVIYIAHAVQIHEEAK
jgi:F-type H+-transporting ATPase subunit a